MTRTWNSGRALALLASAALLTSSFVAPAMGGTTARGKSVTKSRTTRSLPTAQLKGTAQAPGETVIQYDNYDGGGLSAVLSGGKAAWGVRFTLTDAQAPFSLTAVDAAIITDNDGVGLTTGEAIEIIVFADASGSGNIKNASLVYRQNDVVLDPATTITYPLDTPVTIGQGDFYIIIADRSTDDENTVIAYFSEDNGAVDAERAFYTRIIASADSPLVYLEFDSITFSDTGGHPEGNLIVRARGDAAAAGANVTGGGQPTNPSLSAPSNLTGTTAGSKVTLTWTAAQPPAPIAETEPNDTQATAEDAVVDQYYSGSAKVSDPGLSGPVDGDDLEDLYKFTITGTQTVTITLRIAEADADFDLYVFDADGTISAATLVGSSTNAAGSDESVTITNGTGMYIVGVSCWDDPQNTGGQQTSGYTLSIGNSPQIQNYNVYCGNPGLTPSADTFIGTAGGTATSFTVNEPAAGSAYVVTAVSGGEQSSPSNEATGAPCAGGPTISSAKIKLKKNGNLTITGSGFTTGMTILLNGSALSSNYKVKKNGTVIKAKGPLPSGAPFSSVVTAGSGYTITILEADGGCSSFSATAP